MSQDNNTKKDKHTKKGGATTSGDGMYLHVLGCAGAKPTLWHHPTSHVLKICDKIFMIDCGEGTQVQMLRYHLSTGNLHRIFLSHLHADHCLGLPGMLGTMALTGITHPVHIYGPAGTKEFIAMVIKFFCHGEEERIIAHEYDPGDGLELIYEDRSVSVKCFCLDHRVPTLGYRFDEKPHALHLNREMADFYDVPIAYFGRIKAGADYIAPNGDVIPNRLLTREPRAPHSYAFCSDTAYKESIVPFVKGVDLLYHETTFSRDMAARAQQTRHSTTLDAARIAQMADVNTLMIGHYSGRYLRDVDVENLRQEALSIFPRVIAANEGLVVDFQALKND